MYARVGLITAANNHMMLTLRIVGWLYHCYILIRQNHIATV